MSGRDTARYLEQVLALDPAEECGRIMALRTHHRAGEGTVGHVADGSGADGDGVDVDGAALEAAFARVRTEFWSLPAGEVAARLGALDLDHRPDLARARARLVRVDGARPRIERLAAEPRTDPVLVERLRRALVLPGVEAAGWREHTVEEYGSGPRARTARRFAAHVRKHYPELAELERDWLDRLARAKQERRDARAVKGGLGCVGAYLAWLLLSRLVRWLYEWVESQ